MKTLLVTAIKFYQKWLSPMKPPVCRFIPSCSNYAITAIERHGAMKGGILAMKRLLKCHPFHEGGYDPVP